MKQTLFLIGTMVTDDSLVRGYILRHLEASGIRPDAVFSFENATTPLPLHLSRYETDEQVFLFCDPQHSALIARELCTLTHDTVTTKNDLIVPSGANIIKTDYYTMTIETMQLHVVTVYPGHILPVLQPGLPSEKTALLHLLDADKEILGRLLGQLEEAFHVNARIREPIAGWTQCRLQSDRFGDIIGAQAHLVSQFQTVFQTDNVAAWIIEALEAEKKTVTFAESCTGGLLSAFLTKESGASNIFEGALVTYSNRLKTSWIAVDESLLAEHGAVSRPVVEAMSEGALEVAGADYAVAVSGIAGPTGGTPQKPVGTVFVAVRSKEKFLSEHLQLHGDRNYIQEQTVLHALKMLLLLDKKTFFKIS